MTRAARAAAALATVGYLALVGILTLGPTPWRTGPTDADYDVLSPSTWLDPGTWSNLDSREFAANILLFVPLGFLLRFVFPRGGWVGAVLAGAAISVVIEVLQTFTPRVSDPRDLLANTTGAIVGALIAAIVVGIRRTVMRMREPVFERTR